RSRRPALLPDGEPDRHGVRPDRDVSVGPVLRDSLSYLWNGRKRCEEGTALHSLAIASRACSTCALLVAKSGKPDFAWGEGGVRGARYFRIAAPELPHPSFSPMGRRSERPCVPDEDRAHPPRTSG